MAKRAVHSLAGAPLLVRLASRAASGNSQANAVSKIRTTGTGVLLGGPLRQLPTGQTRPSTYRLVRLPPGTAGRPLARETSAGIAAAGQSSQANQLLRQLWA